MRWRAGATRMPIGVDVGGRCIKAAQLARSRAGWELAAAAVTPRLRPGSPLEAQEVVSLRNLLASKGFRGNEIVLAAPENKVLSGILSLPPRSSGAPLEQLARAELSRLHRCEMQTFQLSCWDLPTPARAGNSTLVMAVGCPHDAADALLDLFENEGFDVQRLTVHAAALAEAYRPLCAAAGGAVAALDVGWGASRLALLHGDMVIYERELARCGVGPLAARVAETTSCDLARAEDLVRQNGLAGESGSAALPPPVQAARAHFETMVKEMRIPLSYLANQYPDTPVTTLFLAGGGAMLPGLKDFLAASLALSIRVVLPSEIVTGPKTLDEEYGSSLTAAIGLSRSMGD